MKAVWYHGKDFRITSMKLVYKNIALLTIRINIPHPYIDYFIMRAGQISIKLIWKRVYMLTFEIQKHLLKVILIWF